MVNPNIETGLARHPRDGLHAESLLPYAECFFCCLSASGQQRSQAVCDDARSRGGSCLLVWRGGCGWLLRHASPQRGACVELVHPAIFLRFDVEAVRTPAGKVVRLAHGHLVPILGLRCHASTSPMLVTQHRTQELVQQPDGEENKRNAAGPSAAVCLCDRLSKDANDPMEVTAGGEDSC